MKTATKVLIGLGVLAVVLGLLRVYGTYQNEKEKALYTATQAAEAAQSEEFNGEISRIKMGMYKLRSIDDGHDALSTHNLPSEAMLPFAECEHHAIAAAFLWTIASMERRYASNRGAQTSRILHQGWGKVIGAVPETPEGRIRILLNYPGAIDEYRRKLAEYGDKKGPLYSERSEQWIVEWVEALLQQYPGIRMSR
ncbi:MAG: hypothetical protein WAO35_27605 [Terriglobia bacterium]